MGVVGGVFFGGSGGGRRTDQGVKLSRLISEMEGTQSRIPVSACVSDIARPLQLKITIEDGLNLQRSGCIDFQSDYRARLMHGDKQSFADGKNVAGVDDRARLRANNQSSRERFRGQRWRPRRETADENRSGFSTDRPTPRVFLVRSRKFRHACPRPKQTPMIERAARVPGIAQADQQMQQSIEAANCNPEQSLLEREPFSPKGAWKVMQGQKGVRVTNRV